MKNAVLKLVAFIFIFTFLSIDSNSQSIIHRFSVSFAAGPSIPIGEFAKTPYSFNPDSSYGLAKTGLSLDLKVRYLANPNFGIVFIASASQNKQDSKAYAEGPSVIVDVNKWKPYKFLVGPNFIKALNDKKTVTISFGAYAGICKTILPAFSIVTFNSSGTATSGYWREKMPLKATFSYQVDASVNYSLSKKWYLLASVNLFKSLKMESARYDNYPFKYSISTIGVVAGIGFVF